MTDCVQRAKAAEQQANKTVSVQNSNNGTGPVPSLMGSESEVRE